MERTFKPLQQPLGSNSCLSTCVCAVLRSHGILVTRDEVAEWCDEDIGGCVFFLSVDGLRRAGFDVLEVRDAASLMSLFEDSASQESQEWEPVIVTLKNPRLWQVKNLDHAVVMLSLTGKPSEKIVEYMDPLDGQIHQEHWDYFLQCWEQSACYGFIVRPD